MNGKIRVLRIINRFNLGGPTFNACYLSRYLPEDKYETLLVGGDHEEGEDSSTFIADDLGLKPLILPEFQRAVSFKDDKRAYHRISRLIKEFKPDIVHTHASKAGAVGRLAAYQNKVPVIVHTFHGHVFHSYFGSLKTLFYKEVERYLARRTSAIIAISPLQKDELTAKYKICDPLKTCVIPLGFDLNRFAGNKEENRKKFRNQYQVKEDEVAIGIIGRLAPIKNHGMFVEVAANVKSLTGKKVRFFIVGDGECLKSVQTKAQQCGLEWSYIQSTGNEDIVFTSWRKDTDVVYAGLDMVLLTSLNEGTPVTLIEAQAAGKPVISTDVGGVRDVTSQKTSRLVPSEDVMGMARKVVQTLDQPLLMKSMSEAGWEETGSRFHYTRLVNDVNLLYSQLLQKNNVRKT